MRRLFVAVLVLGCHRDLSVDPCAHDPALCEETGGDDTGAGETAAVDSSVESDTGAVEGDTGSVESDTGAVVTDSGLDSTLADSGADSAPVDSALDTAPADTCVCTPGEIVPVAGTCPGALEKKTKTCTTSCTWGAETCALPKGWTAIADAPIPGRLQPSAVWTGGELIVFGGGNNIDSGDTAFGDGAIYSFLKNSWTLLPTTGASARKQSATVWTGTEMLVWGGIDGSTPKGDGIAYRAFTKTWAAMPAAPIGARRGPGAVWIPTLKRLLVWGGRDTTTHLADGALFDPATNAWTMLPNAPINGRYAPAAHWTGTEVLLWGGEAADGSTPADGALYNPATNAWRKVSDAPVVGRVYPSTGITDGEFLFFGGFGSPTPWNGARLKPLASPSWTAIATPAATLPQRQGMQSWSGSGKFVIWSGARSGAELVFETTGATYDLATATWEKLPEAGAPTPRMFGIAIDTGAFAIVWSGAGKPGGGIVENLASGAIYVP